MLNTLLLALIKDILRFLKKNPGFFELSEEKRRSMLGQAGPEFPPTIAEYLSSISENPFLEDISATASSLHNENFSSNRENDNSRLIESFIKYLLHDFLNFIENPPAQDQLFSASTDFNHQLHEISSNYSYQEITAALISFISGYHDIPYLLVQTPRPITSGLRVKIRNHLQEKSPFSFTIFQVNNKLIGGLRLFLDGTVHDHSWLSQINKITALA